MTTATARCPDCGHAIDSFCMCCDHGRRRMARAFGSGIEGSARWRVFASSARFIAIEAPGRHYFGGIGQRRPYAPRRVMIVSIADAERGYTDVPKARRIDLEDAATARLRRRVDHILADLEAGQSIELRAWRERRPT